MPDPTITQIDDRELENMSVDTANFPYKKTRGQLYWDGNAWQKWTGAVTGTMSQGTAAANSGKWPVKIINSDDTDNSLSTGGQIGQKSMIVGTIDLPVRGVVQEGDSLSQVASVFVGGRDQSGTSRATTMKVVDSRNGQDINHSSVDTKNIVDFHSDSGGVGAGGIKIFSPGGTRSTYYDLDGYEGFYLSFTDNSSGASGGTLYMRWSRDGINTAYNDPDDGTGFTNYDAGLSDGNLVFAQFIPRKSRYVNFVYVQGGVAQGTTYPQLCELNITLFPTFFTSSISVNNASPIPVRGYDVANYSEAASFPFIAGGVDSVSSPSAAYPLLLDSAGRPSINQIVGSTVANNGTDAGNPHKIGYVANSSVPTAVTTTRRVAAWGDLNGRAQVSLGDPGVSLLASASRTTTQTSADLTNATGRGIVVTLDMTVVTAGPSVTLSIKYKDPASGKYIALLTGAAVTTVSTNVYRIYPGLTPVANATVSDVLPRTFQIVVTANNANAGTYSVGYNLIP